MLFFPFGVKDGDVASPSKLAKDFREAHSVASGCTQYQFEQQVFGHKQTKPGTVVHVHYDRVEANLRFHGTRAVLLDDRNGDDDLFQIPYNSGLHEVSGLSWPEWTSSYPELVFAVFSFQYARDKNITFNHTSAVGTEGQAQIRTQIRMLFDGAQMPGAGPSAVQFDGFTYGTGIGASSAYSTIHAMAVLPAGNHRITAEAGQKHSRIPTPYTTNTGSTPAEAWEGIYAHRDIEPNMEPSDYEPHDRVVLGNRCITVIRFVRGTELGG